MKFLFFIISLFFFALAKANLNAKEPPFIIKSPFSIDFPFAIYSMDFHPKNNYHLLIATKQKAYVWDLASKKNKAFFPIYSCSNDVIKYSQAGSYIFHREQRGQRGQKCLNSKQQVKKSFIQLWDIKKNKLIYLARANNNLRLIRINKKEDRLMSVERDGTTISWSIPTKNIVRIERIPNYSKKRLALVPYAISPNLDIIAIRNWQDYYMLFYSWPGSNLKKPKLMHRTEYPFPRERRLFCFSDSARLYFDGRRIRNSDDGSLLGLVPYTKGARPYKALFNKQGTALAIVHKTAKRAWKIKIYSVPQMEYLNSYYVPKAIQSLSFHRLGKLLAVADVNRRVYFFNLP